MTTIACARRSTPNTVKRVVSAVVESDVEGTQFGHGLGQRLRLQDLEGVDPKAIEGPSAINAPLPASQTNQAYGFIKVARQIFRDRSIACVAARYLLPFADQAYVDGFVLATHGHDRSVNRSVFLDRRIRFDRLFAARKTNNYGALLLEYAGCLVLSEQPVKGTVSAQDICRRVLTVYRSSPISNIASGGRVDFADYNYTAFS